jgi:hypothetical protein
MYSIIRYRQKRDFISHALEDCERAFDQRLRSYRGGVVRAAGLEPARPKPRDFKSTDIPYPLFIRRYPISR